jgi:uncharacterized membrane protein
MLLLWVNMSLRVVMVDMVVSHAMHLQQHRLSSRDLNEPVAVACVGWGSARYVCAVYYVFTCGFNTWIAARGTRWRQWQDATSEQQPCATMWVSVLTVDLEN